MADMPLGEPLDLVGTLRRNGRHLMLIVSGGGEWVVDPPLFCRIKRHLGRRVRLWGVRGGFNLINARRAISA